MKYLRYEKAIASKVYREIVDECVVRLNDHGTCIKQDVLDRTGYDAVSDDLRWDYIRRMIETSYDTELIPLAPSFMKRHRKQEEITFTERFVARGNGRRTIGYANASQQNGHFVIHRMMMKTKMAKGFTESAERTRALGVRVGAIKPPSDDTQRKLV
jgi:hypothetical protein